MATKSRLIEKRKNAKNTEGDKIEEKLHGVYGGRETALPTTLMFDHVSPATRLLEKRRQMFEVQEALNSQKDEFNRREDAYRRREDGLRRKDLELQESLIKFNKFLQENESKTKRAERRGAEERKQQEVKIVEIQNLESKLKEKLLEESALKDEVEKNLQYQEYLENVCQQMSKYFPEISDILSRHKTLNDANAQLLIQKEKDDEEMDLKTKEYSAFKKDKENQVLNQNNEIAELQMRLEKTIAETGEVQSRIDREKTEISERGKTLGTVVSSVSNTLDRCDHSFRVRQKKPPREKKLDGHLISLEEQVIRTTLELDELALFIVDFIDIKRNYDGIRASGNHNYGFEITA